MRGVERASAANTLQKAMSEIQNMRGWRQGGSLPGSYPRPGIGSPNNSFYGSGWQLAHPVAGLGSGALSANAGGMSSGYRGDSMHSTLLGLRDPWNSSLGNNYNANPSSQSTSDPMSDIFTRPLYGRMGDQYDYIMNDPRKTNDEIKALLENIRPDAELPAEDREGTPDGLVYPLVGLSTDDVTIMY